MVKDQGSISRISRRQTRSPSPDLALIIPSQQKPSRDSFPTSYKAVASWISAQSGNDRETGVANLIKGLQHSNRLTNSPLERLKITDRFAAEIQRPLPHLNTRFVGRDLPYSPSAQAAFEQAYTQLTELSYGYKIALLDVLLGRAGLTQKSRVHAIYYAMKAIAECALLHSQSYTAWPDKTWRDFNTLFLLAEHEKALDFPVEAATDNNKSPVTINRLYATLATFTLSQTDQFKPHQMEALFSALSKNADKFQLLAEKPQGNAHAAYSVALNSAQPPAAERFSQYAQHHKVRYFDIKPFYPPTNSSANEKHPSDNLSRTQLNKLNQIWSQSTTRLHARAIRHTPIYTLRGLKEIAASLNALADGNADENPFSTTWTLVNESTTGVGLLATENGNCSSNVGDLIAWQPDSTHRQNITCKIGIVRWLRCDTSGVLRAGLETIGQSVCTASIAKAANLPSHQTRIDALLCKEDSSTNAPALLLLPANKFRLGETIKLSTGRSDHDSLMQLAEKLDQRSTFDCFVIKEVPVPADSTLAHSMNS